MVCDPAIAAEQVPRVDDRRVLNGIFWRLRTGAAVGLLEAVSQAYDGDIQMIDSLSIRVHQRAANTQKKSIDPVAWVARGAV
jgi:transposase